MIFFWIKESFKLIGRAKASFFLSLISISVAVSLICAAFISIQLSEAVQKRITRSVTIDVFLKDNITKDEIKSIRNKISGDNMVRSVQFISKKQAADKFIRETGEDFRKILDYNPLPASFSVSLKSSYTNKDSLNQLISRISDIGGVDEVVFQQEFIYRLLSLIEKFRIYIFIAAVALVLISIYIVYSTVKLITKSMREEMETMKLVGAKLSTIKMPIILNSLLTGLLAGLIASGIFYALYKYFITLAGSGYFLKDNLLVYFLLMLIAAPALGFIITIFSIRKISLKI